MSIQKLKTYLDLSFQASVTFLKAAPQVPQDSEIYKNVLQSFVNFDDKE